MRPDKKLCGRQAEFNMATGRASILAASGGPATGRRGRSLGLVGRLFYVLCGRIKVIPVATGTVQTSIEN